MKNSGTSPRGHTTSTPRGRKRRRHRSQELERVLWRWSRAPITGNRDLVLQTPTTFFERFRRGQASVDR
jgi:hypothetical protein